MTPNDPVSPEPSAAARRPSRAARWARVALDVFTVLLGLGLVALVCAPLFSRLDSYGTHDWDQMQSHRYVMVKTIRVFHQFPFWNPWSCGGHTWWGGLESGSTLVSPWLPAYVFLKFPVALRVEVTGTAVLSLVGTWLLSGRYTRSPGARLLVIAAFVVTGRWALQVKAGHMWHLYYAWVPFALYFMDRAACTPPADRRRTLREVALLGGVLAMMVYTGAIYPLPQVIVLLAVYSLALAVAWRSLRPVGLAVAAGVFSFLFAAPRLLPIFDMLRRFPRLTDSNETMDLGALIGIFTARSTDPQPSVGPWGWHEFGAYIGWVPVLLMLVAPFVARRARPRALMISGVACIVLGLGRFHEYAPWGILHDHLPIFESQHVPSRWLYVAPLLLVLTSMAALERVLSRARRRWLLEIAMLFSAAYVALDVGLEAQKPVVSALTRNPPHVTPSVAPYHQYNVAPPSLRYESSDWAPPSMPAMMANVGVIDCATFPGLQTYFRGTPNNPTIGLGAHGEGDPAYRGELYTATGVGKLTFTRWTPNDMRVHYEGANPGDTLVLNQNWDPGWRANGKPVMNYSSAVGTEIHGSSGDVDFRFVPRFFWLGVLLLVATAGGLVFAFRRLPRAPASLREGTS